jgi:hypothetical protein
MSKLHPATRRRTLRMLAAVPYLLPRSVLAAPSRRWTITGTRVEEFDSLDAAMQRLLQRCARARLPLPAKASSCSPVFPWLGHDRAALPGQTVDPCLATITVQQLINHRGGWDSRAANFDPVFSMRRIARRLGLRVGPSSRDIARFMVCEPLQFTPGTQEHYSKRTRPLLHREHPQFRRSQGDGRSVERYQACPRFGAASKIFDYAITTVLTT